MIRKVRLALRYAAAAAGLGRGPDFLIIGAQKAGTTALYRAIAEQAANFAPPEQKELYFFTENYHRGLAYYAAKLPLFRPRGVRTGEATPDYLLYPRAPERVARDYPGVRIVVLLREPVARAHSQYRFQNGTDRTRAFDPLPFREAVAREPERYTEADQEAFGEAYKYLSYCARSRYAEQLRRWLAAFPREQVHILELGELQADPAGELDRLFAFLGLRRRPGVPATFPAANAAPADDLDLATAERLRAHFAPHNEDLYRLVGRRFPWPAPARGDEDEEGA